MKHLPLIILLLTCHFSNAQQIYGSVSGGYQRIIQESQPPLRVVNSSHTLADPWFTYPVYFSFSEAFRSDLNFGHYFMKNIGYELSGSYFKPLAETSADDNFTRQLSGQFYQASFKFLLRKQINKLDLYAKMGVNFVKGKMYFDQLFYTEDASYDMNEARMIYEYSEGARWGFNSALGFGFNLNHRVSINGEVYAIHQPFEPQRGKMTHFTYDDENMMQNYDNPLSSEINFVEEVYPNYDFNDTSKPEKMYKRSYALSGVGVNIGVAVTIWSKKEGSEND